MNVTIKLKEEGGITEHSLFNARVLMLSHGPPLQVTLTSEAQKCDYKTHVLFLDGTTFTFTGFSWGYGGEGPHGLATFLQEAGSFITIDEIAALPSDLEGYQIM